MPNLTPQLLEKLNKAFNLNIPTTIPTNSNSTPPLNNTITPNTHQPSTTTTVSQQPSISNTNNNTINPEVKVPKHVQQAIEYKNKGLIRVSIHRSSAFNDEEMKEIFKTLKVESFQRDHINNNNLILALCKTTTPQHKEIGIQTNSEDIDNMANTINKAFSKHIVIPPMIENPLPFKHTIQIPDEIFFNTKAFKNYTNLEIPDHVAIILSLGSKFSVPIYYEENDFEKLKEAAFAVNEIFAHPLDRTTIRNNITEHIKEYKNKQFVQHASTVRDYFTKALTETKQFLKNNKDIIAAQADKAGVALLMYKQTYIAKIEQLLSDNTTYTILKQSSLPAYKRINEKLLNRMIGLKWITAKQIAEAIRTEVNIANVYALIKTHKKDNPARPVVNTTSAPGYLVAKTATMILTKRSSMYIQSKYSITNSQQALKIIQDTNILPDMKFRSYDARSMFTNISAEKAINAVYKRKEKLKLNDIELELIIDSIKFNCVTNTEIIFNNQIYKQIKGLRMGSSLSPILADFVMEDLLDKVFNTIMKPQLFIKYVDDILTAVEDEEHEEIFKTLNKVDENLKFDQEIENEDKMINFLDFTVINNRFNLKTKWYQKEIASGRIINYLAHHPITGLRNTAIQFVVTMINNSSPEFHEEMINKAKHLLKANSYPQHEIETIIQTAKSTTPPICLSTQQSQPASLPTAHTSDNSQHAWIWEPTNTPKDPTYVTGIPYIPGLSDNIQKDIESSSSQSRKTYRHDFTPKFIKIASQPQHKLSTEIFNKTKKITSNEDTNLTSINVSDSDSDT